MRVVFLFRARLFLFLVLLSVVTLGLEAKASERWNTFWHGDEKCGTLFESPLPRLPGGSYLTAIKGEDSVQAHYQLSSGGTLRLTVRKVGKVPIEGASYSDAYDYLIKRRPLQDRISRRTKNSVVLADVRLLTGIRYSPKKTTDDTSFTINSEKLILNVVAKVRVAEWTEYGQASESSQKSWDRHQCVSYHHELGHILVAAQVLEESEAEWLSLSAPNREELKQKRSDLLDEVGQRISDRQNAYHDALEEMGPAIGRSRPYMELPFEWLRDSVRESPVATPINP